MRTRKKRLKKKTSSKNTIVFVAIRYVLFAFVIGLLFYAVGDSFLIKPTLCANSLTCESDLSTRIDNGALGTFQGRSVQAPIVDLAYDNARPSVLGESAPGGEKHIYIDLANQVLYAYQGSVKILQTLVSTGRWHKTPVGNFHIWEKVRATRMAGGAGADAYDLPNVPFVMYFYHDFGLHGAYWHDNFGHTMSHGCVNLRQVDAQALFNWTDGPTNGKKGTEVSICDSFTAPNKCIQDNPINS